MEIANNWTMPTQSVNSQNPRSVNDAGASTDGVENETPSGKKSGNKDAEAFQLALLASLLQKQSTQAQGPDAVSSETTVELGKGNGNVSDPNEMKMLQLMNQQIKNKDTASRVTATNQGQVFPETKRLLDTRAQESVNGKMAGVFTAGPNEPWKADWIFGDQKPVPQPQSGIPLKKGIGLQGLAEMVAQAQHQLKDAGGGEQQISQLQSMLKEYGADQIEGVEGESEKGHVVPSPQMMGGAAFLNALKGAQAESRAGGQQLGDQARQESAGQQAAQLAAQAQNARAAATAAQASTNFRMGPSGTGISTSLNQLEKKVGPDELVTGGAALGAGATLQNSMNAQGNHTVPPLVLSGNVVPGSMMKDRLTNETLHNMTSGISNFSAVGGGEMRMKLNPGNLGELTIRVTTDGQNVGLQVQASDPNAKKILEESMSSLKESLASQNLILGRMDVSIAAPSSSHGTNLDQSFSQHSQHGANYQQAMDTLGGNTGSRQGRSDGTWDRSGLTEANGRVARSSLAGSATPLRGYRGATSDARLDVMA